MRILMLGNSLTTANELPLQLAEALGAEVVVHARGGARLAEHLNPDTKLGLRTQGALVSATWDYVILQESSNGPVVHRERFLSAASGLCAQISQAGATPVLFATWAYAPTCPKLSKMGISRNAMHELLTSAYNEAAQQNAALVAPVGCAFFEHPAPETLYRPDGVHPNEEGTALATQVIAKSLASSYREVSSCAGPTPYIVYILRCEDGSLYTGITTDIERRFQEHQSRGPKAARYTRTHPVTAIEATWEAPDRATASTLEYRIKRLSHAEKLALIDGELPLSSNPFPYEGVSRINCRGKQPGDQDHHQ